MGSVFRMKTRVRNCYKTKVRIDGGVRPWPLGQKFEDRDFSERFFCNFGHDMEIDSGHVFLLGIR